MTKYISMLRGINVSGQKKVKMADLKLLYENQNCENVITYIQSGNVVFDHDLNDPSTLKNLLEGAIEQQYGFDVYVAILKVGEFEASLKNFPLKNVDLERDGSKMFITYLEKNPEKNHMEDLLEYVKEPEKIIFGGKVLYLHCPNGAGKSKLTNNLFENKLKMRATSRNLKTVTKLCALAGE